MKSFIITIDTEGDNLWSAPRDITTDNANYLPRFQNLCDQYKFKPTYLVNYEMAKSEAFVEFATDTISNNNCEIGMHLHAWNSPPSFTLTDDDYKQMPYLIEYPENVIKEKIAFITELLEETFNVKMLSHRAGRWGLNETYLKILEEYGYKTDCSITPHISWNNCLGSNSEKGGPDYRNFPAAAYFPDRKNLSNAGDSTILEVPVTIIDNHPLAAKLTRQLPNGKLKDRLSGALQRRRSWLRPNGHNLTDLLKTLTSSVVENASYAEFVLHSSELKPGGSPTFTNEKAIDTLYEHLEQLFSEASNQFTGTSLTEFTNKFTGTDNE